jgi:hypothetical protein
MGPAFVIHAGTLTMHDLQITDAFGNGNFALFRPSSGAIPLRPCAREIANGLVIEALLRKPMRRKNAHAKTMLLVSSIRTRNRERLRILSDYGVTCPNKERFSGVIF